MEKVSRILTGLMLGLFALLMSTALLLGAFRGPEHRSYLAALVLAAILFAAWRFLVKKRPQLQPLAALSPVRTGALLTLFCFLLNLAWVLAVQLEPEGDYATFYLTARDLAAGGTLGSAKYVAMFPHILGYSAFLSLFFRLFGPALWVAPLLNVVLTTLSGLILYLLCLRWQGQAAACFVSLLWTLCPSKLLYNTMVLSEPFYTCLLLLFLLLVAELERRMDRTRFSLWLGLPAAAAAAVLLRLLNAARPIAAVPLIAFLLWLIFLRGAKAHDKRLWTRWLVFTAALLVCYTLLGRLWNACAAQILGEEPAGVPGYSIYVGFNPRTNGAYADEDMALFVHYRFDLTDSAVQAQEKMLEEAKTRIQSGQISFPVLFLKKLQIFLGADEGGAYYSASALRSPGYSLWAVISNVYYYALILTALLGTFRLWRARREESLLLAPLYVLGLSLAHMLVEVSGRYHYSIIPMLLLLAAFACGPAQNNPSSGR